MQPMRLYEDSEIEVFFQNGESDFLLITFSDLVDISKEGHFFGKSLANKRSISVLGYVAKRPNWYPASSIINSLKVIGLFFKSYSRVVVYGGSMGGYAAIKHSKLLRAEIVFAFCPQWSADLLECQERDIPSRNAEIKSANKDVLMRHGITANDTSGKIYIFFDPLEPIDSCHSNEIIATSSNNFIPVKMPHIGHHVTTVMADGKVFDDLIRIANFESSQVMQRYALKVRKFRGDWCRGESLAIKSFFRHPLSTLRFLMSRKILLSQDFLVSMYVFLADRLVYKELIKYEAYIKTLSFELDYYDRLVDQIHLIGEAVLQKNSYYLKTYHNFYLFYDVNSCKLIQSDFSQKNVHQLPVYLFSSACGLYGLYIRTGRALIALGLREDGSRVSLSKCEDYLEILSRQNAQALQSYCLTVGGELCVSYKGRILSAREDRTLGFTDFESDWERFECRSLSFAM
ncbi:hypothetical protein [Pseudomonas oryzihabitans]|uniref:hypothetical protein n=1 Tax=Pseudomonas oryzihabitans TaxID=47885 RepID=UPI0011AA6069|nr:hypothetical protein [Pseudomonas oryzihabitans]